MQAKKLRALISLFFFEGKSDVGFSFCLILLFLDCLFIQNLVILSQIGFCRQSSDVVKIRSLVLGMYG